MKRLLPLFLLLILVVMITGMFSLQPRNVLPDEANPVILTAVDDTAFVLVNGRVRINVTANDIETNAGCFPLILVNFLEGPYHSHLKFRDSTYIDRGDPLDASDDLIVYVPDADFVGKDSLKYEVARNTSNVGCAGGIDSAWVFIYVNQAPAAQNDIVQVLPDAIDAIDVLANDTDPDGDALTVDSLGTLPAHGMAQIVDTMGTQMIAYTPNAGYIGPDTLQYYASDDKRGVDSAWVFVTVNAPPMAVADSATTLPGNAVTVDVLANDSDPEGGALMIAGITAGPANGTVAVNGVVTYTPNAGFVGADTFSYVALDPLGGVDTAAVYVLVNTPPVAVDDAAFAAFGVPVDIDVLANDSDGDSDALTVAAVVEAPDNGTATVIDGGQQVRYTPDAGFFGADSFSYEAADGRGGVDQATVAVMVSATANVQFIHNALPAGPVDVYVNDMRVLDGFDFRTATPYLKVAAGDARIDVTEGGAADNSAPFFTTTLTLVPEAAYVAVANGVAGQNFDLLVKDNARLVAADTNRVEFFIVHGVLDAPASGLDVRLLDPNNNNLPSQTLADDINYEELTAYQSLPPAVYNIDATNFNGSTLYNLYRFGLEPYVSETFTLILSGLLNPGAGEPGFALVGFDANGDLLDLSTASEAAAETPQEFVLQGNYPNPFNPTTTIRFDLPEPAKVSVEIVDMLGRVVLTLPARAVEAGAGHALEVDAGRLASGTYFYRLAAQTATGTLVRTGQMVLVK